MTDLTTVIAHATVASRRAETCDPYVHALSALGSAVRGYLEARDDWHCGMCSRSDVETAEERLRYAVYGPPLEVELQRPRDPGFWPALVRAWRRMRHGWRP